MEEIKDYSVKAIRQDFKNQGIFYTPKELAYTLKKYLPDDVDEVYDPTCGRGNLLSVFDDNVKKYGQELNSEELAVAGKLLINFHGEHGDTLQDPKFLGKKFKYIVANPPFSVSWEPQDNEIYNVAGVLPPKSKADYAFILHCLYMLEDTGKAVILNFPGILYRKNAEGKIRQWLIENNFIEQVVHIAGNQFEDTKIATSIIVLNKNKQDTNIVFIDTENELSRTVSFDEIKENNFNLSVSNYIQPETKQEKIDIHEINKEADDITFINLKQNLEINRFIDEIENTNFEEEFFNDLKKFIEEYEKNNGYRFNKQDEKTLIGFLTKKRISCFPDRKLYAELVLEIGEKNERVFECMAYDEIAEKIARNYSTGDQIAVAGHRGAKPIFVVDSCTLIKSKNEQSEEIKENKNE